MSTQSVTIDTIRDTVNRDGIVLLDFWAEWCMPCRLFGPIFEKSSERKEEVLHGKVNTDEQQELAKAFRITSIPTLVAFRDGVMVFNQPGAIGGAQLDDLIGQIEALDMDALRAEIAAEADSDPEADAS